jgi:hypothetical protein
MPPNKRLKRLLRRPIRSGFRAPYDLEAKNLTAYLRACYRWLRCRAVRLPTTHGRDADGKAGPQGMSMYQIVLCRVFAALAPAIL